MKFPVFYSIGALIILSTHTVMAVTGWTTDHSNCNLDYLSIYCSEDERICGFDGSFLSCAKPEDVNSVLPTSVGVADNKDYVETGGYMVNCTRNVSTCTPYTSLWECKASSICVAKNLKTNCAGSVHTSSCGTCLTGYLDCNGNGTGSDDDGCEIQVGGECITSGIAGTYADTCDNSSPVCSITGSEFKTGIHSKMSTTNPLLWGTQYGIGDLVNIFKNEGNGFVIDNSGNVGINIAVPTQELDIIGDINLQNTISNNTGVIYKEGLPFIHNFNYGNNGTVTTLGGNTFMGINAGNFTMGSTATLAAHASYNTGIGQNVLYSNTIGSLNSAFGHTALASNTTGNYNSAFGLDAGRYISNGSTPNQTTNSSVYIGYATKASADGVMNENVFGYNTTGIGSNTVVFGNDDVVTTALKGNVGIGTINPSAKLEVNGNIIAFVPTENNHVATKGYVDAATSDATLANQEEIKTAIGDSTEYTSIDSPNVFKVLQDIRDNVTPVSIDEGVVKLYIGGDLKPENIKYGKTILGTTGVLTSTYTSSGTCGTTFTDERDAQSYNIEQIGDQCWMAENLNYDNGCGSVTWVNDSDEGWCGYYSGTDYDEGLLYQWSAAMANSNTEGAQGLCPEDWHLPTHAEWTAMEREVCTSETCATDFPYDTTTTGWRGTDEGSRLSEHTLDGNNSTAFTGLLTGYRNPDGTFYNRGTHTFFWSSSESGTAAWRRYLGASYSSVHRNASLKRYGFSVRCIKN